ncbi:primase-helicase zinc-binding domain-containing protein [Photorhabdus heterorhabditis]|uniref:primase-helicase zinc-binding domain-containing protein n=2 Tax=Photorhabdus heterorhabditis TaxID=880156 RepID=UPI000A8618B1|nr:primase-helicase zinc-binding domain-containing protein [Photorhabdus heterorhabditis]
MTLITKNFRLSALANEFAAAIYHDVTTRNGGDHFTMQVGKTEINVAIVDGVKGIRELVDSYALEALQQNYPAWEVIAINLMEKCVVNGYLTGYGREIWQSILSNIGAELPLNQHTACPACGGKDRFRFDDKDGNGTFICNQCGAGDGLNLVQRVLKVSVTEAAQEVANIIGIDTRSNNPPAYNSNEIKTQQAQRRAQQAQNQANALY